MTLTLCTDEPDLGPDGRDWDELDPWPEDEDDDDYEDELAGSLLPGVPL